MLRTTDHARDAAGLVYVYPVLSRRAGGVSLGINLNVNRACNWRCIYCQVPDLRRGGPPPVDLARLEGELEFMPDALLNGDYLARHAPEGMRRLCDIALSGDGEPTTAAEFTAVIARLGALLDRHGLRHRLPCRLITNGSQMHRKRVQEGVSTLAEIGGEVWFKLDRATPDGMRRINGSRESPDGHFRRLATCARLCPTWVQTCMFALDGKPPDATELNAYLDLMRRAVREDIGLKGIMLYGLARPSMQAEAPRLSPLPSEWMNAFAERLRALGLDVSVHR